MSYFYDLENREPRFAEHSSLNPIQRDSPEKIEVNGIYFLGVHSNEE